LKIKKLNHTLKSFVLEKGQPVSAFLFVAESRDI